MQVKELIEQLQKFKPDAEISIIGNITNIEDDEQDIDCDILEVWGDEDKDVITLFFGLQNDQPDEE